MMRGIRPLIRAWKLFLYRWALREIHPLHPDIPAIVRAINYWEQT